MLKIPRCAYQRPDDLETKSPYKIPNICERTECNNPATTWMFWGSQKPKAVCGMCCQGLFYSARAVGVDISFEPIHEPLPPGFD